MNRQPPVPRAVVSGAVVSTIVLTGFMGAGKTTVGSLLAARLGWRFLDSDRLVEEGAGVTVAEIFERAGEAAFREMEAAAIREHAGNEQLVLALGGGALESETTREFLAALPGCALVFLEAPLETLIARCSRTEGPVRPVLADRMRLADRYDSRLQWYRRAHWTVTTEGATPEAVAERIAEWIRTRSRSSHWDQPQAELAPGCAGQGSGK